MILSVQSMQLPCIIMATAQICHGNCTEMLLDPLSFLLIFFCIAQNHCFTTNQFEVDHGMQIKAVNKLNG